MDCARAVDGAGPWRVKPRLIMSNDIGTLSFVLDLRGVFFRNRRKVSSQDLCRLHRDGVGFRRERGPYWEFVEGIHLGRLSEGLDKCLE